MPIDELVKRPDRFAVFGRELEITEFDIDTADEATQADYTRDFMTAVFSYPSMNAFLMWPFRLPIEFEAASSDLAGESARPPGITRRESRARGDARRCGSRPGRSERFAGSSFPSLSASGGQLQRSIPDC